MLFLRNTLWYSGFQMEQPLTISTWNINGAFSADSERYNAALKTIDESDSDIVVLPDAWREDSEQSRPSPRKLELGAADFRRLGYTMLKGTFHENRPDDNYARYGFMTLIKEPLVPAYEEIRLGERPAHHLRLDYNHEILNIISLYLNDQSESNRSGQIDDLLRYLDAYTDEPVVLAGDFNAMHRQSRIARALSSRAFEPIAKLPIMNNTPARLQEMADGATMAILQEHGFVDADPEFMATMPSRLPLFQLDHIMTRDGYNTPLVATLPIAIPKPALSDHALLSSTIYVHTNRS